MDGFARAAPEEFREGEGRERAVEQLRKQKNLQSHVICYTRSVVACS